MPIMWRFQTGCVMADRDPRLEQALDLLTVKPRVRNGMMPLLAVTGFALTGAMLMALATPEPQTNKPVASADSETSSTAPQADFQLAGAPPATER